jgi:hypothetical protein
LTSRAQGPGNGQHLLFSAGHGNAFLFTAFGETRKMLVETLDRPAARFGDLGELQVLFHGQAGNDPPVFRDQSDPVARGFKVLHLMERLAVQPDLAVRQLWVRSPGNGAQGRCLARTVAAKKRNDLTFPDIETHALNDVAFTVITVNVPAGKVRRSLRLIRRTGGSTDQVLEAGSRRLCRRTVCTAGLIRHRRCVRDIHRCAPPK